MDLQLPELPEIFSRVGCSVAGIAIAVFVVSRLASRPSKLDAIPTVGSSGWFGSWWAGLKYLTNAADTIQEGYKKHKSAPFKVATPYCWTVVLSSREHVEELRRASDDMISFPDAINDSAQFEYLLGPEILYNPYHASIVRSRLTRNLSALSPKIRNEITAAFDDVLDLSGNEWRSIPVLSSVQEVVCRATNRVIVGLPLCRDPDWIDLNIRFTMDLAKSSLIIRFFPKCLRQMATWCLTSVCQGKQLGRKLLGPILEERRKYLNEYGNEWANKPNDFLSWSMEEAQGPESTVESLTTRMLTINFAAIHSTSNSFTHALLYLAANPQYIEPLREEVEGIVKKEGWSRATLGKMHKVDSFLRECQRMEGIGIMMILRKAKKDFTLSGGTIIPKGTTIGVATQSLHYDERYYKNADVFEPFRFAEMQKEDGEGSEYLFVSIAVEYQPFGHGKHACPGRFFAANEMKTMLAHIVTTYDIRLEDGATRPRSLYFGDRIAADPRARVLFRRRVN